ncbi:MULTISPECIES: hypothetical protein [unclassified Streptomyces]|uniref:hypothetical protein n=1 Tax=unclassified Streptomyces TaxID=2593676 RepID=UPI0022B699F8|nr:MULTISPECIES: hypothetical protein [unclassified Streptomyces]MCZ7416627.1 hypothetical protein [Streptomyces sp. WMMC897]MCZ7433563.1 hypothetical protein [Streptomyces sp. WMMC1477]
MTRTPNARLQSLLEAADWNRTQLARAVRRVAAENGRRLSCDHSTVSRWLAGTRPRPPADELLLEALTRRLGYPVSGRDAGLTPCSPATGIDVFREPDPLRALVRLAATELVSPRRSELGEGVFSISALSQPPAPPLPRRAAVSPPESGGWRAGGAEAAQMRAMTAAFAQAIESGGGRSVRTALTAYLARDVTGWLHHPASQAAHRELLTAAAQLTLLLGNACADCGDDAVAQRYHHTAARLALEARHAATSAIALRTMATHAHDLGHRHPPVVNLARQATDHARSSPPAVQAYSQAQLAVLEAQDDRHAALKALSHAERLYEKSDAASGVFTTYPPGALHYQRAQTLATLGDHSGAADALTLSLRLRAAGERRAKILSHARLAETLLRLGFLEEAISQWHAFLEGYPRLRSATAQRRIVGMRQLLTPHQRHGQASALMKRAASLPSHRHNDNARAMRSNSSDANGSTEL